MSVVVIYSATVILTSIDSGLSRTAINLIESNWFHNASVDPFRNVEFVNKNLQTWESTWKLISFQVRVGQQQEKLKPANVQTAPTIEVYTSSPVWHVNYIYGTSETTPISHPFQKYVVDLTITELPPSRTLFSVDDPEMDEAEEVDSKSGFWPQRVLSRGFTRTGTGPFATIRKMMKFKALGVEGSCSFVHHWKCPEHAFPEECFLSFETFWCQSERL